MATTVLVTTVFTPNLDDATSLDRLLAYLEQTDEGLRSELASLDQDVKVTTTLLNIADIFKSGILGSIQQGVPAISQQPLWGQNGNHAVSSNGSASHGTHNGTHNGIHNGNGKHTVPYQNGTSNGKPFFVTPEKITSEEMEGKLLTNEPIGLEMLLEQIQQGKLELYLHLAPDAKNDPATQRVEEEEIGQDFMQHPFLY